MFKTFAPQTTALGLAAVITLAMLGGVDRLATEQHASSDIPVQQVVIVAQRQPRS